MRKVLFIYLSVCSEFIATVDYQVITDLQTLFRPTLTYFLSQILMVCVFVSAIYNWKGDTRYGLPLEIGETVQILEECVGWYRGFTTKNRAIKGIFPQSYVFLKPCKVDNEGLFESVVPLEEPVIREVTLVLREWGMIWKQLFVVSRQLFYTEKSNEEIVARNFINYCYLVGTFLNICFL